MTHWSPSLFVKNLSHMLKHHDTGTTHFAHQGLDRRTPYEVYWRFIPKIRRQYE